MGYEDAAEAAEAWDADGAASLPWDTKTPLARLKLGTPTARHPYHRIR
jgi:hypothetical protein